jgi:hypothetical protein
VGRPVSEIIAETANVPTNADNYFERASAAKYLGYVGPNTYYDSSAICLKMEKNQMLIK